MTELEREWRAQTLTELPHLHPELSFKLLHKLLIQNIYTIKHITLPNGTNLMTPDNFKIYYKTPTKLKRNALHIAEQLFCHTSCTPNCHNQCTIHPPPQTLKIKYISDNQSLILRTLINSPQLLTTQHPHHSNPPTNITKQPHKFPINIIL